MGRPFPPTLAWSTCYQLAILQAHLPQRGTAYHRTLLQVWLRAANYIVTPSSYPIPGTNVLRGSDTRPSHFSQGQGRSRGLVAA